MTERGPGSGATPGPRPTQDGPMRGLRCVRGMVQNEHPFWPLTAAVRRHRTQPSRSKSNGGRRLTDTLPVMNMHLHHRVALVFRK